MSDDLAVIFDMDGVLIDSHQAHYESWQILADENDWSYSMAEFEAGFGRTSRENVDVAWGHLDLDKDRCVELVDRKEELFREILQKDFPAMEGAAQLIQALFDEQFRLALGTSGPNENAALVLGLLGVAQILSTRVTADHVTRGKPDPQVFQLAAEKLGVPPEKCLVVEDAPAGIEAAKRAGMCCVGLTSTGRTAEQLHQADFVVDSLFKISPDTIRELIQVAS